MMQTPSYQAAGVNVELGDRFVERLKPLVRRPGHANLKKAAGGYASVYPLTEDRWIAVTTDGVGTKVLLAHEFNEHITVGIDLVAMCANDLICVGAKPTLFLDYFATGKLDVEQGLALIEGIAAGCDEAGMLLVGGETAEMPDVYEGGHYDLAGFAVGELAPENLLTGETIRPGQKIIGIASSGIHSNGLSLARKLFQDSDQRRALLTPTRLYVRPVMHLLKTFPKAITGMAHITGGGWRNLFRLSSQVGFEIHQPLPVLPVFESMLARGLSRQEAYHTFNMGMGMAILVDHSAEAIVTALNAAGFDARIVGEVTDQACTLSISTENLTLTPVIN